MDKKKNKISKSTREGIALTLYAISAGFIGSLAANYLSTAFPTVKTKFPIFFNSIGFIFVGMFLVLMIILFRLTRSEKEEKVKPAEEEDEEELEEVSPEEIEEDEEI